jgi:hypothetical protein
MKEAMEKLGNTTTEKGSRVKKALAAVTGFAVLGAMSGCSSDNKDEWVFAIKCPQEQEVNVTDIGKSSVVVQCESEDSGVAPISVELIKGDGITVQDSQTRSSALLTVGYYFETTPFTFSVEPEITSVEIREETQDARLSMSGVSLTEVSVSPPQE